MGWLRLVGSLKSQVFFAEYGLFYRALFQKKSIILRSLLIVPPHTTSNSQMHLYRNVQNPIQIMSKWYISLLLSFPRARALVWVRALDSDLVQIWVYAWVLMHSWHLVYARQLMTHMTHDSWLMRECLHDSWLMRECLHDSWVTPLGIRPSHESWRHSRMSHESWVIWVMSCQSWVMSHATRYTHESLWNLPVSPGDAHTWVCLLVFNTRSLSLFLSHPLFLYRSLSLDDSLLLDELWRNKES